MRLKKATFYYTVFFLIIIILTYIFIEIINERNLIKNQISIKKYHAGTNIFTDRNYINKLNDKILAGKYIIKIPRHFSKRIILKSNVDINIYRSLCKKNDNKEFRDWEVVNFSLDINGKSCNHDRVVKRKFKAGKIKINPGGPVSSNPIFINGKIKKEQFSIKIDSF
tara:strand:+ start:115 stop:615 length:501 start_codon:yes stop_codon:yes gene_type:complete